MAEPGSSSACPQCGAWAGAESFCEGCQVLNAYPASGAHAATRLRRLAGALIDAAIFFATVGIGWLIWFFFTAPKAQTPGKRLLQMYTLRRSGEPVSTTRMWAREILAKRVLFISPLAIPLALLGVLDAVWILWDRNLQTLHDKIADTVVVYVPTRDEPLGLLGGSPTDFERRTRDQPPPGGTGAYAPDP